MSRRRDERELARFDAEVRTWAGSAARELALDLFYDRERLTRPYGVGVVLDPGEKAWTEVPVRFNLDTEEPGGTQSEPGPAVSPWLVTSTRIVGRSSDSHLLGYRWEHVVGVRVGLCPGEEVVALDVTGEPLLRWFGPGVAPLAVAALFRLFGPASLLEHPGLAPLRDENGDRVGARPVDRAGVERWWRSRA